MTRKRKADQTNDAATTDAPFTEAAGGSATAVADAPGPIARPAYIDGPPVAEGGAPSPEAGGPTPLTDAEGREEPPRAWADPFKTIFSCPEQGFELGEDRRFKQRVFRFAERPDGEVLAALKAHGFTYRATEKAWTVPADPASRKLTDELARTWAGPNYQQGLER